MCRRLSLVVALTLAGLNRTASAAQVNNRSNAMRLDSESDRTSFRRWFAFLAEVQYFTAPEQRPSEIVDCSSLVRYAYREALRQHNSVWAAESRLPLVPAMPSVTKYSYPRTPTGPRLFRIGLDSYAQFANAETLYHFNVDFVTRDAMQGERGDLLFFRQPAGDMPYHTMILLGTSQITSTSSRFVVYDTGPEGTQGGQIKRLSMEELLQFPDPRWRPTTQNPAFLGVFRWNILQDRN